MSEMDALVGNLVPPYKFRISSLDNPSFVQEEERRDATSSSIQLNSSHIVYLFVFAFFIALDQLTGRDRIPLWPTP